MPRAERPAHPGPPRTTVGWLRAPSHVPTAWRRCAGPGGCSPSSVPWAHRTTAAGPTAAYRRGECLRGHRRAEHPGGQAAFREPGVQRLQRQGCAARPVGRPGPPGPCAVSHGVAGPRGRRDTSQRGGDVPGQQVFDLDIAVAGRRPLCGPRRAGSAPSPPPRRRRGRTARRPRPIGRPRPERRAARPRGPVRGTPCGRRRGAAARRGRAPTAPGFQAAGRGPGRRAVLCGRQAFGRGFSVNDRGPVRRAGPVSSAAIRRSAAASPAAPAPPPLTAPSPAPAAPSWAARAASAGGTPAEVSRHIASSTATSRGRPAAVASVGADGGAQAVPAVPRAQRGRRHPEPTGHCPRSSSPAPPRLGEASSGRFPTVGSTWADYTTQNRCALITSRPGSDAGRTGARREEPWS